MVSERGRSSNIVDKQTVYRKPNYLFSQQEATLFEENEGGLLVTAFDIICTRKRDYVSS